jgi:hypothetical protein
VTQTPGNPRFLLRAFEHTDAVRTAFLTALLLDSADVTTRDAIVGCWADRTPRHVSCTGRRSIRARVGRGLGLLRMVNAVTLDGDAVGLGSDPDALAMAAGNLGAVEGLFGEALPPSMWLWRPHVPDCLAEIQQAVIDGPLIDQPGNPTQSTRHYKGCEP